MATGDPSFLDLRGPQWDSAVRLYQKPRVSEACLRLQDALGVDVCLLLFALFAARERQVLLDEAGLEELDRVIADWRDQVIRPLRAIRRRLKSSPPREATSAAQALREQIKKSEIDAEQIELAMLARHFDERPGAASAAPIDSASVLNEVAAFFAARAGGTAELTPEIQAALRDIAAAMS